MNKFLLRKKQVKQDSKDLNPRSLANTPQSLNSTNALTISTSSNAPESVQILLKM